MKSGWTKSLLLEIFDFVCLALACWWKFHAFLNARLPKSHHWNARTAQYKQQRRRTLRQTVYFALDATHTNESCPNMIRFRLRCLEVNKILKFIAFITIALHRSRRPWCCRSFENYKCSYPNSMLSMHIVLLIWNVGKQRLTVVIALFNIHTAHHNSTWLSQ